MLRFGFCWVMDRVISGVSVQISSFRFRCHFGYGSGSFSSSMGPGFGSQGQFLQVYLRMIVLGKFKVNSLMAAKVKHLKVSRNKLLYERQTKNQ